MYTVQMPQHTDEDFRLGAGCHGQGDVCRVVWEQTKHTSTLQAVKEEILTSSLTFPMLR